MEVRRPTWNALDGVENTGGLAAVIGSIFPVEGLTAGEGLRLWVARIVAVRAEASEPIEAS